MTEVLWGPMLSPIDVEEAVIATLREWLPASLRNAEEVRNLPVRSLGRPAAPESYHGGLDWESEQQDTLPEVIVICEPAGEPERNPNVTIQFFTVQVGCVILASVEPLEANARKTASIWAAASMVLGQHGALGSLEAQETLLIGSPKAEMLDPENRRLALGLTTWHVSVDIFHPSSGPVTLKEVEPEGPYSEYPVVTKDTVTVVGEPTATPF
jgi:hypothetical protein